MDATTGSPVLKARPLGKTPLRLSELGFGSNALGNLYSALD
jgi:aryl-alcohol dehydrogenase-like predicted oxidoreductase